MLQIRSWNPQNSFLYFEVDTYLDLEILFGAMYSGSRNTTRHLCVSPGSTEDVVCGIIQPVEADFKPYKYQIITSTFSRTKSSSIRQSSELTSTVGVKRGTVAACVTRVPRGCGGIYMRVYMLALLYYVVVLVRVLDFLGMGNGVNQQCSVFLASQGGHNNQDPQCTQKPMYTIFFTHHIRS